MLTFTRAVHTAARIWLSILELAFSPVTLLSAMLITMSRYWRLRSSIGIVEIMKPARRLPLSSRSSETERPVSIDDLERDLLRQRTNPLRWVARSKSLWVATGLFGGTLLLLTINRVFVLGISATPSAIVTGAGLAIVFLYATRSLGPDRYDFSFSNEWYRRASRLPGLSQVDRRTLAIIAVRDSGTEAMAWIRSKRFSQAEHRD
jgi:hypothetical protein